MNRGSFHTRSFRLIHLSVFRCRWTKNGFTGPKTFRGFRDTSPRTRKGRVLASRTGTLEKAGVSRWARSDRAIASNKQTGATALVTSFSFFVVFGHHKHPKKKINPWTLPQSSVFHGLCFSHGYCSSTSLLAAQGWFSLPSPFVVRKK